MDLRVSEIIKSTIGEVNNKKQRVASDEFNFTLNKLDEDGLQERLTELINNICDQGNKISKHMDIKDLRDYRILITEFINEIITNSHKFKRENFLDKRGRHRVYGIIRVVNKELDSLAQELLKSEKNNLNVLEKIGQIQGLLLDIMT